MHMQKVTLIKRPTTDNFCSSQLKVHIQWNEDGSHVTPPAASALLQLYKSPGVLEGGELDKIFQTSQLV